MKTITLKPKWLAAAGFAVAASQANAFLVLDVANLSANIQQNNHLTNIINNQEMQITNERMHLFKLTTNDVATLRGDMEQIRGSAVQFKEGISKDKAFLGRYKTLFPDYTKTDKNVTIDEMNKKLNEWSDLLNQNTLDTLSLSSQVLSSLPDDQRALDSILSSSQNAQGILQAIQAGNQAMGLIVQQLIKINTQLPLYNQADLFFKQKAQSEADMIRRTREHASSEKEAQGKQQAATKPTTANTDKSTAKTDSPAVTPKPVPPKPDGKFDLGLKIGPDGSVEVSGKGMGIDQSVSAGKNGASVGTNIDGIGNKTSVDKNGVTTTTNVGGNKNETKITKDGGENSFFGSGADVSIKGGKDGANVGVKDGKDGANAGVKTAGAGEH
jgi:type IV secretion system protein TrbJ